jgi:hypothetical protein
MVTQHVGGELVDVNEWKYMFVGKCTQQHKNTGKLTFYMTIIGLRFNFHRVLGRKNDYITRIIHINLALYFYTAQ